MNDNELIARDGTFNQRERDIMARVACMIIGPSEEHNLPAADDEAILAIILTKACHFAQVIKSGANTLEQLARAEGKPAPASQTPDELSAFIDQHRGDLRSFSRVMTTITAQSYYQDARVLRSLNMPARPPFPEGHDVEQGDWTLLDQVKQRGPMYRQT